MIRQLTRCFAALTLAGLIAGNAAAGGEGWTDDFAGAKTTAAADGKDLLLDFTGSDWCGWCIKLNEEVFSQDAFKAYAKENFVLVELDFPNKKKLSDEVKAQNAQLQTAYNIQGYPTIYLTDAKGLPYAKTGYQRGGAEAYVEHLKELKQKRVNRDDHMAAAEKAQGVEKAKHLHEAMQVVGDDIAVEHYKEVVAKVVELDADNAAGLKKHYQNIALAKEYRKQTRQVLMGARNDPGDAVTQLDAILAKDDLTPAIRQEVLAYKSQIQLSLLKDKPAAKATLLAAIAADPESDMAKQLQAAIERMFGGEAN